jgi:hypothetical protein
MTYVKYIISKAVRISKLLEIQHIARVGQNRICAMYDRISKKSQQKIASYTPYIYVCVQPALNITKNSVLGRGNSVCIKV